MISRIAVLTILSAMFAAMQWPRSFNSSPPQTPIPGAPTTACDFANVDINSPIRLTTGDGMIPYQFACGVNRPADACVQGSLPPGLVVNLGAEQNSWVCVTGGDSTSGWIPASHLADVPAVPSVPVADWLGWWHQQDAPTGLKSDRLLITHIQGSSLLHVSGRAYWYGAGNDVHFGEVNGDARAIGVYLHVVDGGCIIDLKFDPVHHKMDSYDNMGCGGMNVRFSGEWNRFKPR